MRGVGGKGFAQFTCLTAGGDADIKAEVTSELNKLFCHKILSLCAGSEKEKGTWSHPVHQPYAMV